ncbi:MAG: Na+/phosphate symporter [Bacteriovoracaceae bacterium]|jgi:Na+/phosphate symporter
MFGAGVLIGGGIPELLLGQRYSSQVKQLSFLNFSQRLIAFIFAVGFAHWLNGQNGEITKIDALNFYGLSILIGTILCFSFQGSLKKLSQKIFPNEEYPDNPKLDYGAGGVDTSAAFSLIQARRQVGKLSEIVERLFSKVRIYLENEINPRTLAKIKDYERVTDNIRQEVEEFLLLVMEQPLLSKEAKEIKLLQQLVGDLEGVADYLDKIATYKTKLEEDQKIPEPLLQEFVEYFLKVERYFFKVIKMVGEPQAVKIEKANLVGDKLKKDLEELRINHIQVLIDQGSESASILSYSDMLLSLRKIRGHARHISNALG